MNTADPLPGLLHPDHVLARLVQDLSAQFSGIFSPETVHRFVFQSHAALAKTSRVSAHLPVLTARFAADRLTAMAQSQGLMRKTKPQVLFVCVQNAGRSQMGAALLHLLSGGTVQVRSAGSMPSAELESTVLQVMAEQGADLTAEFPKPLTDEVVRAADVVVTMGCGDACPVYPGKRYLDWVLPDAAGQGLAVVRQVRDQIRERVEDLLTELFPVR